MSGEHGKRQRENGGRNKGAETMATHNRRPEGDVWVHEA